MFHPGFHRWARRLCAVVALTAVVPPAIAQDSPARPPAEHQHAAPAQDEHAQHVAPATLFPMHEGSGTSWMPQASPMYARHGSAGGWEWMWHGNGFLEFLADSGARGAQQAGSINWVMGMARREAGGGRLGVRGMLSLEPLTIPGCGYPDLLATGETCDGEAIHDRQHPHDLFMELAAEYERALPAGLRWHVYGGPAGEPALGPVAYPHRTAAMPNPLAPIGHHWLDATHITFGVITTGLSGGWWRAEASAFNGREPDEERWDLDLGALDSFSGRIWVLPSPSLALQVSAGHLEEAEAGHAGEPRVDVDRFTVSLAYTRAPRPGRTWATTVAWGRNVESGDVTHAVLAETSLGLADRHTWFGRFEMTGKPAHDLDVHGTDDVFTVAKAQAGYVRYVAAWRGLQPGLGGHLTAGVVPRGLESVYGRRVNVGAGIFLTLRPAAHTMP